MLLLGSTWRRRLESFQIVVVIGIMIVIWKICYESIQWPKMPAYYNSISDDESGAGNATLGVCCEQPLVRSGPDADSESSLKLSLL